MMSEAQRYGHDAETDELKHTWADPGSSGPRAAAEEWHSGV
jgi:hypothetical protein